jgi:hypothetical protein
MKLSPQMVKVRIKLLGFLSQFGADPANAAVQYDIPAGSSIADLIQMLAENLGAGFQRAVLDPYGNLHGGLEVVINQEHVPARHTSSLLLEEDCEVLLIPMIGGGVRS